MKTASGESCEREIQTNSLEVDDRGSIYIVDRADGGMHVVELIGAARNAASFR